MKSKFINQVIYDTLILAALCWLALGERGLALFLGALWGSLNVFLLQHLLKSLLIQKDYLKSSLLFGLKCPLLYLAGYGLLKVNALYVSYLLIGFSLLLGMLLLFGLKMRSDENRNS